jgi:hypothetical protein
LGITVWKATCSHERSRVGESPEERLSAAAKSAARQDREDRERALIIEYEQSRLHIAEKLFRDMPDLKKVLLCKRKAEALRQHHRVQRRRTCRSARSTRRYSGDRSKGSATVRKVRLRRQAQQAVLAFAEPEPQMSEGPRVDFHQTLPEHSHSVNQSGNQGVERW